MSQAASRNGRSSDFVMMPLPDERNHEGFQHHFDRVPAIDGDSRLWIRSPGDAR